MAFGFQVWRPDGKLQLSVEGRQTRTHSTYTFKLIGDGQSSNRPPGVGQTFTQAVSGMVPDDTWYILIDPHPPGMLVIEVPPDELSFRINSGYFTVSCSYYTNIARMNGDNSVTVTATLIKS